jgi:hypothetical protein
MHRKKLSIAGGGAIKPFQDEKIHLTHWLEKKKSAFHHDG